MVKIQAPLLTFYTLFIYIPHLKKLKIYILTKNYLIVYPDGTVCISILVSTLFLSSPLHHTNINTKQHPPGDDKYGYEKASERWSPVHTVETILLSVISMLSSPNDESPANIEAAVSFLSFI